MFYIVETQSQLDKLSNYNLQECFVSVIRMNDEYHSILSDPCLVYIHPVKSKSGYIICINHSDSFNIPDKNIWDFINTHCKKIFSVDKKELLYCGITSDLIYDINLGLFFDTGKYINHAKYNTKCHISFYRKYNNFKELNRVIPIQKHYEKWENLYKNIDFSLINIDTDHYKFFNSVASNAFFDIERNGIRIDDEYAGDIVNKPRFIKDDIIYSHYNLLNKTGRPTCAYNGYNFLAISKKDDSRKLLIPKNDMFVEFDFRGYQIKLICSMIDHKIDSDDVHEYFAKIYFNKDEISSDEYNESKKLTFWYTYGEDIPDYLLDNEFFAKMIEFKKKMIEFYDKHGYVESPFLKRPIYNIDASHKILPYLLQAAETERNIPILERINNYLADKNSKVVLYGYDSILIDFSKEDEKQTLIDIQEMMEEGMFSTSFSVGENYHEMS